MRTHLLLFVILASVQLTIAQKDCSRPPLGRLPVSDMTNSTWNGIRGGLYPDGRNDLPPDKIGAYRSMIDAIVPLSNNGTSDPSTGKIVMIGVGASNPRTEFNAFIAKATSDPTVNTHLILANTCVGGQGVQKMNQPSDSYLSLIHISEPTRPY